MKLLVFLKHLSRTIKAICRSLFEARPFSQAASGHHYSALLEYYGIQTEPIATSARRFWRQKRSIVFCCLSGCTYKVIKLLIKVNNHENAHGTIIFG